jgi:hypothetical protein
MKPMFLLPVCCRLQSVTDNNSVQNLNQTRIDGTENSLNNAKKIIVWAYICTLDWTIFDGLRLLEKSNWKNFKIREAHQ